MDGNEEAKKLDLGEEVKAVDLGEVVKPVDLGEVVKPVDLGEEVKPLDLDEEIKPPDLGDEVKKLIEKVQSGKMNKYLESLNDSDFGLYIPIYIDQNTVKPMMQGYSQMEKDLVVSVSKDENNLPFDAKPVAWMGGLVGKDSKCSHGGTAKCTHCSSHTGACRHCTHQVGNVAEELAAPELNYDTAVEKLINKKDLLDSLAEEEFGLTLLHGHNSQFMFTKLPVGYVSVISNGLTTFRTEAEVLQDETFVPNIWRSVNGELKIAGGYSQIKTGN